MSAPTFSVIIPLYNKERQIAQTLRSVCAQTCGDLEVVVVDDGSRDGSADVVRACTDPRVRLVAQANAGVSAARNRGIREARGEWLVMLDADDELKPEALAVFSRLAKRCPKANVLVGGYERVVDGRRQEPRHASGRDHHTRCPYLCHWLNRFYPRPGATAVRRTWVGVTGGMDERMSFFEDYEFGLRIMQRGPVAYTEQVVNVYRVEGDGLSHSQHAVEREMAYYIPTLQARGLFWRACLYENLEYSLDWWRQSPRERAYYEDVRRRCFSRLHAALHWLRQQWVRHGWI